MIPDSGGPRSLESLPPWGDRPAPDIAPRPPAAGGFPVTLWDIVCMVLLAAAVVLSGTIGLGWLVSSGEEAGRGGAFDLIYGVLALEVVAIFAAVSLFAKRRRRLSWADIGLRPPSGRIVRRAIIGGLLCFVVLTPIMAGVSSLLGEPGVSPQAPFVVGQGFTVPRYIAILLLGGGLIPLAEEVFFRGIVYQWMRKHWGPAASVMASAVVFGAAHAVFPLVAITAFLVGLVLALVYERSGTLWASVIVHAVFNSVSLSVMFLGSAYIEAIT